jgi:hypothetical protein
MLDNYSVCDATFNFSFILMGPALCSNLLKLKDDKQVIVIKPTGHIEDVSGQKVKSNLESISQRNSELAMQLQQYKNVNTQYL